MLEIALRMFEFPESLCIQINLSNKNGEDYFTDNQLENCWMKLVALTKGRRIW